MLNMSPKRRMLGSEPLHESFSLCFNVLFSLVPCGLTTVLIKVELFLLGKINSIAGRYCNAFFSLDCLPKAHVIVNVSVMVFVCKMYVGVRECVCVCVSIDLFLGTV